MNERAMDAQEHIERQMRALLELIEADRGRRCAQILDPARASADAVRLRARVDARARRRATIAAQRQRRGDALAAARARLATRTRLHAQRHAAELLRSAWALLPGAMRELWHDAAARASWVEQVVAAARSRLSAAAWRVVHAADWPAAEQEALMRALPGITLQLQPDAAIDAGLKVIAGGNIVDGTVAGLLADRNEIEAALLRLLEGQPEQR